MTVRTRQSHPFLNFKINEKERECCGMLWKVVDWCGLLWHDVDCCGMLWKLCGMVRNGVGWYAGWIIVDVVDWLEWCGML